MSRTGLLAVLAVMLASSPSFGQFGGMGGMGGGMGGMAQGMQPGMMMQGGRFAGAGAVEVRRSAQVEMEGGQRLSGTIDLKPVIVDGDLGRYMISPYRIKVIRFLKPVDGVKPVDGPEGNTNDGGGGGDEAAEVGDAGRIRPAALRARRVVGAAAGGFQPVATARGKVVTTTDKEIVGAIHVPTEFRLELEFGALDLETDKLRSITFTDDRPADKPVGAGATAPATPNDPGRPAPVTAASLPRYFRHGSVIIVISPVGDRVTLYNFETRKSESVGLSGSKEAPLEVNTILDQNLVALMLKGPKVTRIAVADTASCTWHSQELRQPVDGRVVPIVGPGVAVYNLGRDVYAYGAEAQRWDVALLPDGMRFTPVVGTGFATIESDGHIYTFSGKTGKWKHVDVRAVLDGVGAEKR